MNNLIDKLKEVEDNKEKPKEKPPKKPRSVPENPMINGKLYVELTPEELRQYNKWYYHHTYYKVKQQYYKDKKLLKEQMAN
jgi:hypothetical protein